MIKAKTIAKKKVIKELPLEYVKLKKKLQTSLELIKDAHDMIGKLEAENNKLKAENLRLKSYWTHKLRNLLKW